LLAYVSLFFLIKPLTLNHITKIRHTCSATGNNWSGEGVKRKDEEKEGGSLFCQGINPPVKVFFLLITPYLLLPYRENNFPL
jgi:hypothetical protein